jgi:hypothetical protein
MILLKKSLGLLCLIIIFSQFSQIPAQEIPQPTSTPKTIRGGDAAIDRTITMPNAETVGNGIFTLNNYEIALFGLTYGITDDTQASLLFVPYLTSLTLNNVLISVKTRLYSNSDFIFSLQPFGAYHSNFDEEDDDDVTYTYGCAFASNYMGVDNLVLSIYAPIITNSIESPAFFSLQSVGAAYTMTTWLKLLFEINCYPLSDEIDSSSDAIFAVLGGFRLYGKHFSAELSLLYFPQLMLSSELLSWAPFISVAASF